MDPTNLATRFPDVYALGDVTGLLMAKAGVFAEAAGAVVADDIAARLRGEELQQPYEGAGSCYIEFGGGMVGKVEPTSSAVGLRQHSSSAPLRILPGRRTRLPRLGVRAGLDPDPQSQATLEGCLALSSEPSLMLASKTSANLWLRLVGAT